MLDYAGIAIFVFGNKRDATGDVVLSNGMREEFESVYTARASIRFRLARPDLWPRSCGRR